MEPITPTTTLTDTLNLASSQVQAATGGMDWKAAVLQSLVLMIVIYCIGLVLRKVHHKAALEAFWKTVDISDNLSLTTKAVKSIPYGWQSGAFALVCFAATFGFGWMAWTFDLHSSWAAMAKVREMLVASLAGLAVATYIGAMLTYMPTLLEMFGARFARFNIIIVQIAVVGLSIFDLFTDLPEVQQLMNHAWPFFSQGGILGYVSWYLLFALWWFLSSYGWELLTCIFAWAAVGCTIRFLYGVLAGRTVNRAHMRPRRRAFADDDEGLEDMLAGEAV